MQESMAAPVDPVLSFYDDYWNGLVGKGQGSGWFGMNTVSQELMRLQGVQDQFGGLSPEYAQALAESPVGPGFGVMGTVGDVAKGIRAFHGSPHTFDAFDMSRIGTGEGAQAYGHGLYFAENEGVARGYRDRIAGAEWVDKRGLAISSNTISNEVMEQARKDGLDILEANDAAGMWSTVVRDGDGAANFPGYESVRTVLDRLGVRLREKGSMYEVRINANPDDFLDWDKPLSEQSQRVADVLTQLEDRMGSGSATIGGERVIDLARSHGATGMVPVRLGTLMRDGATVDEALNAMVGMSNNADWQKQIAMLRGKITGSVDVKRVFGPDWRGADIAKRNLNVKPEEVAAALRDAGVPGIKYLDAGSRGAGDGSRNYVVFDDKLIEILRRYGLLPPVAVGAGLLSGNDAEAGQ